MITSLDAALINNRARRWMVCRDPELIKEVAEMYLIAADAEERYSVWWWWNEGVRDYCTSEEMIKWAHARLDNHVEIRRSMEP